MADEFLPTNESSPNSQPSGLSDEIAYIAPMAVFLLLTAVGGWYPAWYPVTYLSKTAVVALLLVVLWRHYTHIRWNHAWLGVIVGILIAVQWVGMEKLLPAYPKLMSRDEPFDPFKQFASPAAAWSFIAVRWAGASLLVPVMEELFWRDYLWRTLIAPNNFKLAHIGEWDAKAFFVVAIAFGAGVHFEWLTAIVCGMIFGGLLLYTRSLGACIIAHGVANFLLGLYVVAYRDWIFW